MISTHACRNTPGIPLKYAIHSLFYTDVCRGLMEGLHLLRAGLPDVAPGRGFDRLVLRIAESLGRSFRLAGLRFQPLHPVCPPAALLRLCGGKPRLRVIAQFAVGPEAALVLRCGVDHAGNVTARAKHEL